METVKGKSLEEIKRELETGVYGEGVTIGEVTYYVVEKTPYSFRFYSTHEEPREPNNMRHVVSEVFYDLRYKKYYMRRNGRDVKFNIKNLDTVFPRDRGYSYMYSGGFNSTLLEQRDELLDLLSTEDNKGMYRQMVTVIGALDSEAVNMTSRALIRLINEYYKLELIYKAGIPLSGLMRNDRIRRMIVQAGVDNTKRLHQIFGITKSQMKFILEYGINGYGSDFREYIQKVHRVDTKDMELYRTIVNHVKTLNEKYDVELSLGRRGDLGNLNDFLSTVQAMKAQGFHIYASGYWEVVMEQEHPNPKKLLEYLLYECLLSQGMEIREAISVYRDYHRMCKGMNYERFDRYPKYLKTMHDVVARNHKQLLDRETNEKFVDRVSKYKELEAKLRGYEVIAPKDASDLVYEGNVLQHCVGSYVQNIVKGRTAILFLRDNSDLDTPLVTVEVKGDKIVQARGQANRLPSEEEKDALRRYAKAKKLDVVSYI